MIVMIYIKCVIFLTLFQNIYGIVTVTNEIAILMCILTNNVYYSKHLFDIEGVSVICSKCTTISSVYQDLKNNYY